MDVRWVLVLVVATAPLAGCIDGFGIGSEEPVTRTKVDLDEEFHADETVDPDSPDMWARTRDVSFQVGPDETDLTVVIEVTFDQDNPLPGAPSGNVTVNLTDPGDESRVRSFERSGSEEITIGDPATGTWNLRVQAQGDGSFAVVARTMGPAD